MVRRVAGSHGKVGFFIAIAPNERFWDRVGCSLLTIPSLSMLWIRSSSRVPAARHR